MFVVICRELILVTPRLQRVALAAAAFIVYRPVRRAARLWARLILVAVFENLC